MSKHNNFRSIKAEEIKINCIKYLVKAGCGSLGTASIEEELRNEECIKNFYDVLDKWVLDGKFKSENIYIKQLNVWLMYQLDNVKNTVVKVTSKDPNFKQQPKIKDIKIGRNELCHCGSGKKFKKCCIKN